MSIYNTCIRKKCSEKPIYGKEIVSKKYSLPRKKYSFKNYLKIS